MYSFWRDTLYLQFLELEIYQDARKDGRELNLFRVPQKAGRSTPDERIPGAIPISEKESVFRSNE